MEYYGRVGMVSSYGKTECEKPNCTKEGTKTYRGENGNTLELCTRHYYNLVADHNGLGNIPNDSDPLPFWDSGIRCSNSTSDTTLIEEIELGTNSGTIEYTFQEDY